VLYSQYWLEYVSSNLLHNVRVLVPPPKKLGLYNTGRLPLCLFVKKLHVMTTDRIFMDWIDQGLTSHPTHFRSFRRRRGDCGISQDCSRSQTGQSDLHENLINSISCAVLFYCDYSPVIFGAFFRFVSVCIAILCISVALCAHYFNRKNPRH